MDINIRKVFAHICIGAMYYTGMDYEPLFYAACIFTVLMVITSIAVLCMPVDDSEELSSKPTLAVIYTLWTVYAIIIPFYNNHPYMSLFNTLAITGFGINNYILRKNRNNNHV